MFFITGCCFAPAPRGTHGIVHALYMLSKLSFPLRGREKERQREKLQEETEKSTIIIIVRIF